MIKIAIVDDHQMFLEGLKHIINSQPNFSVVYSNNNPLMFLEDFKFFCAFGNLPFNLKEAVAPTIRKLKRKIRY